MHNSNQDDAASAELPPMFARGRNEGRPSTELRAEIPKDVMAVIDAHWMAQSDAKASRNSVVNEILRVWAEKKWHEASLVLRLAPGNPAGPDSLGSGAAQ